MVSREELHESIRAKIESGEWPPGSRLPSTSQLMRDYGVGDSTVYNVMETLKKLGLVTSIKGGARYVAGGPTDA